MLDRLKADIKTSLLAGDRFRVDALKMAQAALMNARIAKTADLTEQEETAVIQKEIKKRKEAAEMYAGAGAVDRAENETKEVEILSEYVPKMLEGQELEDAVKVFVSALQPGTQFSDAMKQAIDTLGNVDKGQLARLLKETL